MRIQAARLRLRWLFALVLASGFAALSSGLPQTGQPAILRLALPMNSPQLATAPMPAKARMGHIAWPASAFLALDFAHARGSAENVQATFRVTGKEAIASLCDGAVEAAWAFAPAVLGAITAGCDDLVIAGVVMRSFGQVRLIVRTGHASDWHTGTVAVSKGTILESFVLAQLRDMDKLDQLTSGRLKLVHMDHPESGFFMLSNHQVPAASVPGVYAAFLDQTPQNGSHARSQPDFTDVGNRNAYQLSGFLITRHDCYERHRDAFLDLLRAYRDYGDFVAAHPRQDGAGFPLQAPGSDIAGGGRRDLTLLTHPGRVRRILEDEARLRIEAGALASMPDFGAALSHLDDISARMAPG